MNRKKILFTIATLLLLAGCAKEPVPADGGAITVEATLGAATKVSAGGDAFAAGDQIAVYAWTGSATANPATRVVDGVVNTFDGSSWTPATPMRWQVTNDPHYFLGVYPASKAPGSDFTAVPYALTGSAAADDLLLATTPAGVKNTGDAVQLGFHHVMARLDVNLRFRTEWATPPTADHVSVSVEAKHSATVNYLTETVTASGAAAPAALAPATAATGYALGYSGLQVPQDGVRKIIVEIDGYEYEYASTTDIPLAGGKYTTLNLVLGKDKLELAGVSVLDWESGTDLPGGEAKVQHDYVDMGEVIINGAKMHLLWATCNMGAENPWDYGDYFAWGETTTKDIYAWVNYAFMQAGQADDKYITKYTFADGKTEAIWYDGGGNFIGDGKTSFADYDYADDAARQIWGGDWRLPTDAEWTALRNTTLYDWVWTTDYNSSGKNGMLVTRKTGPCAGNSIFLPAAGYRNNDDQGIAGSFGFYWSSSLFTGDSGNAWTVGIGSGGVGRYGARRYYGQSLRPVICVRYPVAATEAAPMDVGKVLAADGKIYADAASADANGGGAQAVIAYVGSVPNYFDNFLAIAMDNAYGDKISWGNALTKVGEYAAAHPITIGGTTYDNNAIGYNCYDEVRNDQTISSMTRTSGVVKGWRMPSVTDWRYIFEGFGGPAVASQPAGVENYMVYGNGSNIRNAIDAACGNTSLGIYIYWSSSGKPYDSSIAWTYSFGGSEIYSYGKDSQIRVRSVFAY